jgi:hypothetical protein
VTSFRLRRDGEPDLEFKGKLLGEADSRERDHGKWALIRIYRTDDGRYVTEAIRCSDDSDPDVHRVRVVEHAAGVVPSLIAPGREGLTVAAVKAIRAATAMDPDLYEVAIERI